MKKYKLYWLDGHTEIIEGYDVADAFNRSGIGNGALPALDYYEEIKSSGIDKVSEKEVENYFGKKPELVEVEKLKIYTDGFNSGYDKANEWHNIRENPNDLPTDTSSLYSVLVYSWDFGLSHLYSKYGTYIPTVCEWNGEYFKALDRDAYTNARNIKSCLAWKEIIIPKEN